MPVYAFIFLPTFVENPAIMSYNAFRTTAKTGNEVTVLETWIIFIVLYGLLKGSREPMKKALMRDVNVLTALFAYTFIGFLMTACKSLT